MYSWWLLLFVVPVGAAAAWLVLRRNTADEFVATPQVPKKAGAVEVTRNQPRHREHYYYGVSVQIDNNPCDAARAIADHRYLSEEAPHFPLPDCDRKECRCMVRPQDDRRAGYDRRGDSFSAYGSFELDRHSQKRNEKRERRNSS